MKRAFLNGWRAAGERFKLGAPALPGAKPTSVVLGAPKPTAEVKPISATITPQDLATQRATKDTTTLPDTARNRLASWDKEATVPSLNKQFRRALQMVKERSHDFHGVCRQPDGMQKIIDSGKLTNYGVTDAEARPLFGRGLPADGGKYIGSGGIAVPHERLVRQGNQEYIGPSREGVPHVAANGAVHLQPKDYVIPTDETPAGVIDTAQRKLHMRPMHPGALSWAEISLDSKGQVPAASVERDVLPRFKIQERLASEVCTTCRKPKHYGPCAKPERTPPEGRKLSNFNSGLRGTDQTGVESPSMSPNYTAGTVSDSGPARARPGNPADQARSAHQDFFRPMFQNQMADEWTNAYGALTKTNAYEDLIKTCSGVNWGPWENRGPTRDPYSERIMRKSPPIGRGPVGDQAVAHAFGQLDSVVDSTCIESGAGAPQGGPAVLG